MVSSCVFHTGSHPALLPACLEEGCHQLLSQAMLPHLVKFGPPRLVRITKQHKFLVLPMVQIGAILRQVILRLWGCLRGPLPHPDTAQKRVMRWVMSRCFKAGPAASEAVQAAEARRM